MTEPLTAEERVMPGMDERQQLAALERRGDELEAFSHSTRQANDWIAEHGTDPLVEELRQARADRRRMRLGTVNTLILLHHIDRLESVIALGPKVLP